MLAEALQAEVDAYIAAHAAERDENGRRLVVRNGYHQPRASMSSPYDSGITSDTVVAVPQLGRVARRGVAIACTLACYDIRIYAR